MTVMTDIPDLPRPRVQRTFVGRVIVWLRTNLFPTIPSTIVSLLLILVLGKGLISLVEWGWLNAVWSVPDSNNTAACRAVRGRRRLLGRDRREAAPDPVRHLPVRAAVACGAGDAAAVAMYACRRSRAVELALRWPGELRLGAFAVLDVGRRLRPALRAGRPVGRTAGHADPGHPRPRRRLSLAIPLALLRHSPGGGVGKALAVAYIELTRSVPLLAVLFLASVMIPLFLPQGMDVSKLLRVLVAFALFTAAYLAEVVRGGLLSIPEGQFEAAALGLSPSRHDHAVVLPQALTTVLPASSTSSSPSSRPPRSSSWSASST